MLDDILHDILADADADADADWRLATVVGTTVRFRFPVAPNQAAEEADRPAPLPRAIPCLVIDRGDRGGPDYVRLAYGTHRHIRVCTGGDLIVARSEAMESAGLGRKTRFALTVHVDVPLTHHAFAPCALTGSPILGQLDARSMAALETCRARTDAVRDIAAAEQEARRGARRERQRDDRARSAATAYARWGIA
jgi:hypothetical protein